MAIKASNQITFTEHKKIVNIEEWYLATPNNTDITASTAGWTTAIQHVDETNKYLWNYEKVIYSIGSPDISEPVIIGIYIKGQNGQDGKDGLNGQDGKDGRGINNIIEHYTVTTDTIPPESETDWALSVPELTPENKYLWNYEVIEYTDDTTSQTQPSIIGVYGDSGVDAITFEIYSVNGFIFKEDTSSIELYIAAFEGSTEIKNAIYQWSYWDESLNEYHDIDIPTAGKKITIHKTDEYAFKNLRCTMLYNDKTYYDYITLTKETIIYTSLVKFFDGSNILHAEDLYIVAYIELYKNNEIIETVKTTKYCGGVSTIDTNTDVITPPKGLSEEFKENELMYFIINTTSNNLYDAILGQYTGEVWKKINNDVNYEYQNSLYKNDSDNIIVISKESINKSQNIDFTIFKDGQRISNTNVNVIDSNDPIISATEPQNAVYSQLWLDTSTVPYVLKIYTQTEDEDTDKGKWIECSEKIGGAIFTSQPTAYHEGDLWILANGERCNGYGPGTMLKAITTSPIFNSSHWIDADENSTELKNNIKQYFEFNSDNGLKIGQKDNKFYVNINASEMGFYDNSNTNNPHQKVVSIGNTSATIKGLKVEENATFDCNVIINAQKEISLFGNFILKKESNGSMSLAMIEQQGR